MSESANEAGLSAEEKDANQLQIDSILQTIDRLANSTSFQGTKLLNGNFDYTTSGVVSTLLSDVTINSARLADTATMAVDARVTESARTSMVFLSTGLNYNPGGGSPFNSGSVRCLGACLPRWPSPRWPWRCRSSLPWKWMRASGLGVGSAEPSWRA